MDTKTYISAFSLSALLLLGMAACTSDDVQELTEKTSSLELRTEIVPSRATITGTQFSEGSTIQLMLQGTANNVSSCSATLRSGQWVLDRDVRLNKNRVVISGLFNQTDDITPTASGDQTDILVGTLQLDKYAVNRDNPDARLQFCHVLSRISFDLQEVGGGSRLTRCALVNLGEGTAIGTHLQTGYFREMMEVACNRLSSCGLLEGQSYTPAQEASLLAEYEKAQAEVQANIMSYAHVMRSGASSLVMPVDATLSATYTTSVSMLAIPTHINDANRVALQLTMDGKTYQVEMPDATWNSGYHYRYPVTIDLTSDKHVPVTIGTASIDSWGTATTLEGVEQTLPMD